MATLPLRRLGTSDLQVSVMSLGSWRTFERIPREQGLAVMQAAKAAGINFLDDARYNDETGTAPIPTGYSEVVFGELFRAAGWARDQVIVANKLWWEHWPDQSAADELDASLGRMGLDHVDLIYAIRPPEELPIATVVEQIGGLLESGRARFWGTGMWSGEQLHEALDTCEAVGVAAPVAAQMAHSLVDRTQSMDPPILAALDRGSIGLVASYALAGGTLSGKYLEGASGQAADDEGAVVTDGKERAASVLALARHGECQQATLRSPMPLRTRTWQAWSSAPPRLNNSLKTCLPTRRFGSWIPTNERCCSNSPPSNSRQACPLPNDPQHHQPHWLDQMDITESIIDIDPDLYHRHGRMLGWEPHEREADPTLVDRLWDMLNSLTDDGVQADLDATLSQLDDTAAAPMATIGFCAGARAVFRTLMRHPRLFRAEAMWHPSFLVDESDDSPHVTASGLTRPLFIGIGEADEMQPLEGHRLFLDAVQHLPDVEVAAFPGADHGYTWAGWPGHHPDAAAASYAATVRLFRDVQGSPGHADHD